MPMDDRQTPNQSLMERGLQAVMGVKDASEDTTIQTDRQNPKWDGQVTFQYIAATFAQIGALIELLWLMDFAFAFIRTQSLPQGVVAAIVCGFFAFVTLRSRRFSVLDNTRNKQRYTSLQRPGWAPPPLAFPIVWMSIAVLRVIAAYLVWSASGQTFLCLPLIVFMVHLSLGDTWNTIFTVEGRLGAAVPAVIVGPLLSVALLTITYYQTLPLAGWIIFPSLVWLMVATVLCISLWQLNGKEPLYPVVAKSA